MTAWLSPAAVNEIENLGLDDAPGNAALTSATAAAVAFVERVRPDLETNQTAGYVPTDDVKHGAAMLAARLYERRANLLGVAPSAGYEDATSILRYDPDIERLLQIGRWRPFGFGAAS